jgi:hypothetical protein
MSMVQGLCHLRGSRQVRFVILLVLLAITAGCGSGCSPKVATGRIEPIKVKIEGPTLPTQFVGEAGPVEDEIYVCALLPGGERFSCMTWERFLLAMEAAEAEPVPDESL